jgi:cytoskeletal protein CcmA (bactofilin family)
MDSRGVGNLFKKINAGLATISNDTTTLISEGTQLTGDIAFSGTLEIMGTVVGNILSEQKDARVRILGGGVVKGDIKSAVIEVNGSVEGSIYALDRLVLESSCKVNGNVHYTNMEMRPGAQLMGSCICQQVTPPKEIASQAAKEDAKIKDIRSNQQTLDKQWQ